MKNEEFVCLHCGHNNPVLQGGCRNHCQKCLYSLHVDKEIPGDRDSSCHSLMKPVSLDYSGKKGYIIIHKCQRCGKEIRNKTAKDDEMEAILKM